MKPQSSAEFMPVSANKPEFTLKRTRTVQIIVIFDNERITMRKDFDESKPAKWWYDSFICSLKNLFHFIVTNRV